MRLSEGSRSFRQNCQGHQAFRWCGSESDLEYDEKEEAPSTRMAVERRGCLTMDFFFGRGQGANYRPWPCITAGSNRFVLLVEFQTALCQHVSLQRSCN